MTRNDRDDSVSNEPHFQEEPPSADASEAKVEDALAREARHRDAAMERARHSVFDEPSILPKRSMRLIDVDWNCRRCRYNLRGLLTGHPCPECGSKECHFGRRVAN